jgi:hypothetical protein
MIEYTAENEGCVWCQNPWWGRKELIFPPKINFVVPTSFFTTALWSCPSSKQIEVIDPGET